MPLTSQHGYLLTDDPLREVGREAFQSAGVQNNYLSHGAYMEVVVRSSYLTYLPSIILL